MEASSIIEFNFPNERTFTQAWEFLVQCQAPFKVDNAKLKIIIDQDSKPYIYDPSLVRTINNILSQ